MAMIDNTEILSRLEKERNLVSTSQKTRADFIQREKESIQRQQNLIQELIKQNLPFLKNKYVSAPVANGLIYGKLKNICYENSSNVNIVLENSFLESNDKIVVFYLHSHLRTISVSIDDFIKSVLELTPEFFLEKRNNIISYIVNVDKKEK